MEASKFTISPRSKVGELLDNFPELESVLIEMSPAFEKLKNPVLRKTVARVATLQQIAVVGGLKVDEIINRLRKASGQDALKETNTDEDYIFQEPPDWFPEAKIVTVFDATTIINSGGSPMNDILRLTNLLKSGEVLELTTQFIPAPIIDMLRGKEFKVYSIRMNHYIKSYITK